MLSQIQIKEIREHLEKSQNPIFFFDNDTDGLCSFLLLRRCIDRGKGVAIKSFPELNPSYAKRISELNADYVFILDKPEISEGFIKEVEEKNFPMVWLDHHQIAMQEKYKKENISYYNPIFSENPTNEPTTYWAYKISGKKEDLWLAIIGCIGDGFLPDFADEFASKYPDLWKENIKTAFQALYTTEIGKIIKMLNFSLKDKTSNVVKMLKYLVEVKSPCDLLKENSKNSSIFSRFEIIDKKYSKLIEKAKEIANKEEKLLFFQYGGDLSLSANIANELSYLFPEKIIVVSYIKGVKANISVRGKDNVLELTKKAIENIEGATGGGHEHATGAQMAVEYLPIFRENLLKLIKK